MDMAAVAFWMLWCGYGWLARMVGWKEGQFTWWREECFVCAWWIDRLVVATVFTDRVLDIDASSHRIDPTEHPFISPE